MLSTVPPICLQACQQGNHRGPRVTTLGSPETPDQSTKQVDAVTSKTDTCARGAPHAFSAATVVFVGEQRMAAATERRWARHDTLSRFDRLDLPSAAGLRTETYRDGPRARVSTASGN